MEGGRQRFSKKDLECGPGMIWRAGYTRRSKSGKRTRVSGKCVPDRGLPGHGPNLFQLTPGALGKFGYAMDLTSSKRHSALRKAVKKEGYAAVARRLNALKILNKRTNPTMFDQLRRDLDFVQTDLAGYSKTYSRRSRSPKRRSRSRSRKRS